MLTSAGFTGISVRLKQESRDFIKDWLPGSHAEDYVMSAEMKAVKPAEGQQPPKACCPRPEQ